MNGVCSDMIHLTHKRKFVYYSGNYDTFVKTKVRALLQNPPPLMSYLSHSRGGAGTF